MVVVYDSGGCVVVVCNGGYVVVSLSWVCDGRVMVVCGGDCVMGVCWWCVVIILYFSNIVNSTEK